MAHRYAATRMARHSTLHRPSPWRCCTPWAPAMFALVLSKQKRAASPWRFRCSVLQATLDVGPCGDLTFIVGGNGRPLTKESFGNLFKDACKAEGVTG